MTKEEWCQRMSEDLEYISSEITQIRDKVKTELQSRYTQKTIIPKDFVVLTQQSYLLLLNGQDAPLKPIYLKLSRDTFSGHELAEVIYKFDETRDTSAPFIGFQKQGDYGLLYPNPDISYTASMSLVFKELTGKNWKEVKSRINSLTIYKKPDGLWEAVS